MGFAPSHATGRMTGRAPSRASGAHDEQAGRKSRRALEAGGREEKNCCAPVARGKQAVDPVEPVKVAVDSGAARGAEPAGAGTGDVEPGGADSGGAEPGGAELEVAESGGVKPGGAEPERAESGGPPGVPSRPEPLSPQQLHEWYTRRCRRATRGAAGGAAARGTNGAGGASGAGASGDAAGAGATGAAGAGGARTGGTGDAGAGGAAGVGAVGAGAVTTGGAAGAGAAGGSGAGGSAGVVAGEPGAEGTGAVSAVSGGTARPRSYYVPLLQQVLGLPPSTGPPPPLLSPPPVQSQSQLQPASPLHGPSPYSGPTRGLTERREPESHPASPESRLETPVRTGRRVLRQRPPPVLGTHSMTLRPSTTPQRVPLPSPPASSLPALADPESNSLRTASPTVTCLMATIVSNPSFESTAASALVNELLDFAAHCRLDHVASLVVESESRLSVLRPSGGDLDAPDIPTPRSYAEAIKGPYFSQGQVAMDAKMASKKSTGIYVDEVPPPGANIVNGMWIFREKRPPGSPPVFEARYVARGFSQRQGVDFFQTFSPTPKMTTLRGSLHKEIWLCLPPGFTGSFPAGTQWSLSRPVYGLRQSPREWHDTLKTTLAALDFAPSTADPSLFLRTDTTLPPFYVLVYVDDLVFATADTEALAHVKSELQKRHTRTDLGPLALRLHVLLATFHSSAYHLLARYVAPGRNRKVHWDAAKRVLRYLCSTSGMGLVLRGWARVVLTGHADAS
ncbi:unnamed protein product [Closterium sp. NIES-53]